MPSRTTTEAKTAARTLVLSGSLERRLVQLEAADWHRAGDPATPRVAPLVSEARRHAQGGRYLTAAKRLAAAERVFWDNRPARPQAGAGRLQAKLARQEAQKRGWRQEGRQTGRDSAATRRKDLIKAARELLTEPTFRDSPAYRLAQELHDRGKIPPGMGPDRARHILREDGIGKFRGAP